MKQWYHPFQLNYSATILTQQTNLTLKKTKLLLLLLYIYRASLSNDQASTGSAEQFQVKVFVQGLYKVTILNPSLCITSSINWLLFPTKYLKQEQMKTCNKWTTSLQ